MYNMLLKEEIWVGLVICSERPLSDVRSCVDVGHVEEEGGNVRIRVRV